MENIIIQSEEDAYEWLKQAIEGKLGKNNIILNGWPILTIRLAGDKFNQSLTPSIMKGLVDFQSAINRSVALSKYGVPDPRKLTKEEKDQLEFTVKIEEGSTILDIDLQQIITEAIKCMDGTTAAITVLGLGLIWGGTTAFKAYLNHRKEIRALEAKSEEDRETLKTLYVMSKEETERTKLLVSIVKNNPDLDNASRFAYDAKTDLLKSFTHAEYAEIDNVELDSETSKILIKNARRKSEEIRLDGDYKILRNDTSDITAFKVRIQNLKTNDIIDALVQDETLDQRNKQLLQNAEWNRKPVHLSINAKSLDGEIKNAVVISVHKTTNKKA